MVGVRGVVPMGKLSLSCSWVCGVRDKEEDMYFCRKQFSKNFVKARWADLDCFILKQNLILHNVITHHTEKEITWGLFAHLMVKTVLISELPVMHKRVILLCLLAR